MLDPEHDELRGGHELLVEGDRIKEVSSKPIKAPSAGVIDCGGRTLMPGLIDSHVHVVLSEVSIPRLENVPLTLMTARAAQLMRGMLDRGFTTRARHRRRRLGPQGGHRQVAAAGAAAVHRRQGAGADGWAQRRAAPHRARHALPLLRCAALRHGSRRRRRRGAQGRARGDAAGQRPGQDHDVGRRRLALRSARQPAVLAGGGGRRRRGGARLRPLCLRPRLHGRGDHAGRARRRAHHRARQPDRRGERPG